MTKEEAIVQAKQFRVELDAILQRMKQHKNELIRHTISEEDFVNHGECIAQHILSFRDLENAIMRQGMVLKNISQDNPYPNSYKPENTIVDKTADELKL